MSVDIRETGKRTREGVVLSNKMNKTLIVEVTRLVSHAQFKNPDGLRITVPVHAGKDLKRKISEIGLWARIRIR